MSENLSRLDRLRIVREWQAYQLGRTDRTIAELEEREATAEPMTREQALRALTEDGITACPYCRPDRELGVL
ncbi:DUF6233 domain-containing protein [Streptomyces sp900116325]|uniref:DUF6233 domain-containing protein n=1 Tax=Streptomyces sp. 900116325 TaxID=3154295 RepID=UPI0033BD40C7